MTLARKLINVQGYKMNVLMNVYSYDYQIQVS